MKKNRIGNSKSIYTTLGASSHSLGEREKNDYYATDPDTLDGLLAKNTLDKNIRECSCGEGHLSKRLIELGYNVISSDLIDRGYGKSGIDFLKCKKKWKGDILTNPPYRYGQEFVEKALDIIDEGKQVIMFLKLQFLEGQKRKEMFEKGGLKKVLVFSKRQKCAKNGDFEKNKNNAVAYARYIREKGYKGLPVIDWI